MTYFEIGHTPAGAAVGGAPDIAVGVNYSYITTANSLAQKAFDNPEATDAEKDLANAVFALVNGLTDIFRGFNHGRIGLIDYPAPGAHLED